MTARTSTSHVPRTNGARVRTAIASSKVGIVRNIIVKQSIINIIHNIYNTTVSIENGKKLTANLNNENITYVCLSVRTNNIGAWAMTYL